jgi:hypothetical protein
MAGFDAQVLGTDEAWTGWRMRMRLYRDAATVLAAENPSTIVVCMDAYDALCTSAVHTGDKQSEFVDRFRSFKKPVVLSVEAGCFLNCMPLDSWYIDNDPLFELAKKSRWKTTKNGLPYKRYVNGGLLAGNAASIAGIYDWMLKNGATDDQIGLSLWSQAHPNDWYPDVAERLFSNKILGERLSSKEKHAGPMFTHFPGTGALRSTAVSYNRAARTLLGRSTAKFVKGGNFEFVVTVCVAVFVVLLLFVGFVVFLLRRPALARRRLF